MDSDELEKHYIEDTRKEVKKESIPDNKSCLHKCGRTSCKIARINNLFHQFSDQSVRLKSKINRLHLLRLPPHATLS